jgi:phage terminase large subunit-like protein
MTEPTLGPLVAKWIEANLVHGPGDLRGQPIVLRAWQRAFLDKAYALTPDGRRRYDRVLDGKPRGSAKTERAAMIALVELAGPSTFDRWDSKGRPVGKRRESPEVVVAAAGFDQAGILFNSARTMVELGPLAEHYECFDAQILPREGDGSLTRIYSAPRTADGMRPTCTIIDELHEWPTDGLYVKLAAARAKRRDSWELAVTTAGWDLQSILGRLYTHGQRVQAGELDDSRFLVDWREASRNHDLSDPVQLEAAIREAHPAVDDWIELSAIVQQFQTQPEHVFRRYWLNQWVEAPTQWIAPEVWAACAAPDKVVAPQSTIVLGFDGSYNRDSTALVGCTYEAVPHLFLLGCWERPAGAGEWSVDRADVLAAITDAIGAYRVQMFVYDDAFGKGWSLDLDAFTAKGLTVAEWPTRSHARMGPASAQFAGAITDRRLTHDGDPRLAQHVAQCVSKGTRFGLVPTKDTQDSTRHIDNAIAAIIAFDAAHRPAVAPEYTITFLG